MLVDVLGEIGCNNAALSRELKQCPPLSAGFFADGVTTFKR